MYPNQLLCMRNLRLFSTFIYVLGLTAIVLLILLAVACKKDDNQLNPEQRKEQLSQAWKVNAVLVNGQPYAGTEYNNWQFDFRKDGTYTFINGGASEQGKWELDSNGSRLLLDKGSSAEVVFTILQLDTGSLEVERLQTSSKTGETKLTLLLKPVKK